MFGTTSVNKETVRESVSELSSPWRLIQNGDFWHFGPILWNFKIYVVLRSLSYILPFKSPSLRYAPWSVMVDLLFPRKAHQPINHKGETQDQSRVGPQAILNRRRMTTATGHSTDHRTRAVTKHQAHNVGLCLIALHSFLIASWWASW